MTREDFAFLDRASVSCGHVRKTIARPAPDPIPGYHRAPDFDGDDALGRPFYAFAENDDVFRARIQREVGALPVSDGERKTRVPVLVGAVRFVRRVARLLVDAMWAGIRKGQR